jgi:hypothetical protein
MSFLDNLKKINELLSKRTNEPWSIVEKEGMFRDILREMRSTPAEVLQDRGEGIKLARFTNLLSERPLGESSLEKQIREDILRDLTQQRIERLVVAAEDHPELLQNEGILLSQAQTAVNSAAMM